VTNATLLKRLEEIEKRVEKLEKTVYRLEVKPQTPEAAPMSANMRDLLSLPDSLRKTMMVIQELKEATAEETAQKSGRTRSIETIYLNQLARMGQLTRVRKGRKIYFKPLRYY